MVNFDLGQFNVTKEMGLDPEFSPAVTAPIGEFDVTCAVTWSAAAGTGWHKVFRYTSVDEDGITYYTDKTAWITETGHGGIQLMTDIKTNDTNSANDKSGHINDSIAKDFMRHIANEVMGGSDAGASKGATDIFSNEDDLLTDITNLHDQFKAAHKTALETSSSNGELRDNTNIPHTILSQLLQNDAGISRVNGGLQGRTNENDQIELLESGDKILFKLTIEPKGGDGASPLGNNTIGRLRYKVVVTLADA